MYKEYPFFSHLFIQSCHFDSFLKLCQLFTVFLAILSDLFQLLLKAHKK